MRRGTALGPGEVRFPNPQEKEEKREKRSSSEKDTCRCPEKCHPFDFAHHVFLTPLIVVLPVKIDIHMSHYPSHSDNKIKDT